MFAEPRGQRIPYIAEDADATVIPPSSLPRIPQSATRPSRELDQPRNPVFSIQATPTRKPTSQGKGLLDVMTADYGCQSLTPLQLGRSSGQLFNLRPESATSVAQNSWSSQGVLETPVKQKAETMPVHSQPVLSTPTGGKENIGLRGASDGLKPGFGKTHEDFIYKSLGWDDDLDD
jgi:DNA replication regulator SLD3